MAVIALNRSESSREGLHPFDPRQHMRGVAELVGSVFANELDATGRALLREMQFVGRFSPIFGSVLSLAFFEDFVSGFVWIERGQVVGNVTLQPADAAGVRWRISNVAVAPEHRRRGIAYRLMLATLREIACRGGSWAILQVRTDNPSAYKLYQKLGFTDVCRDGVWRMPILPETIPQPDPMAGLQRLHTTAWLPRWELAQAARSELARWASTLNQSDYEVGWGQALLESLGRAMGLYRVERWGIAQPGPLGPAFGEAEGKADVAPPARVPRAGRAARPGNGRLAGVVEGWASGTENPHRLRFDVHPSARGEVETALLAQGLFALRTAPQRPVVVEHSGDHAEGVAALEAMGFRAHRVLLTMRRMIIPEDTELPLGPVI